MAGAAFGVDTAQQETAMMTKRSTARTVAVLAALLLPAAAALGGEAEPLTNVDIIGFVQANISPNLVVDKIRNSPADFDLSGTGVIALRQAGVPDEVITAMTAASGGPGTTLAPLPGIGFPSRASSPISALEPPPSLGEIPPSPFPNSSSPFTALDPLPSMPAPLSMPSTPASSPGVPSIPSLPAQAAAPAAAPIAAPAAPAPSPAFSSPVAAPTQPQAFSSPAAAPVQAPVAAAAPAATPAFDAGRLGSELANIATGSADSRRSAMAWLIANSQNTLQPLRDALRDQRPELQAAAVYALGTMRDAQSLAAIRGLVISPSQLVRANAAEVLADVEDFEAIAAAERALTASAEPLDGHIRLVGHARLVRTAGNLALILANNKTAANRAAAAWSLAEIGRAGSAGWPALENALLKDEDPAVRREAARAVAVFHDPASAKLLESACRRDPEVRKITLQAMADYPETVEFLVSVMNLGGDQIAADELETARTTLAKLTGQDFGMDGNRWSGWLSENKFRFDGSIPPAPVVAASPSLPPPPPASPAPAAPAAPTPGTAQATGRQVDVKAWGIVTDPAEIPMAPEVDATPNLRRAGIAGGLGGPGGFGSPGVPGGSPPSSDIVEGPMAPRGGYGASDSSSGLGGWGGVGAGTQTGESSYGSAWGGGASGGMGSAPESAEGVRLPMPPGLGGSGGDTATTYSTPSFGGSSSPAYSPPPTSQPAYGGSYDSGGYVPPPMSPTVGTYSSSSNLIVPTADGVYTSTIPSPSPQVDIISATPYASPSSFSDEVHSLPYEATADLVPSASTSVPMYTGDPEPSMLGAYQEDSSPLRPPSAGSALPPPSGAAEGAGDDYSTLSFPGDTDTFGLGDPYFDEDQPPAASSGGAPSLFQGMTMPRPPGAFADDEYADGDQADDNYEHEGADTYASESFDYDFEHPDSPYSTAGSQDDEPEEYEEGYAYEDEPEDEWDDDVEDLSSIPGFGTAVQSRGSSDDETEDEDSSAPAATRSSSSQSMTVTTERPRRPRSEPAASEAPAAPVASTPAPSRPASVEIPPDASDKASRILSALADLESGGGSSSTSRPQTPPPAPIPAAESAEEGDFEEEYESDGEYLTDDEVYEVEEDSYPGGFIPAAPGDSGPSSSGPVGTLQELPLLGDGLAPLPVPSDIGSYEAEESAPAQQPRRRRAQ